MSTVAFFPFFLPCLRTQEQLGPGKQMGTPLSKTAPLNDSSSVIAIPHSPTHTLTHRNKGVYTKQACPHK